MNKIKSLDQFVQKFTKYPINEWIKIPDFHLTIYTRVCYRILNDEKKYKSIDLSNIVIKENKRGKGLFTEFLRIVEQYAIDQNAIVYVECVHDPRFQNFFKNRNYIEHNIHKTSFFFNSEKVTTVDS